MYDQLNIHGLPVHISVHLAEMGRVAAQIQSLNQAI